MSTAYQKKQKNKSCMLMMSSILIHLLHLLQLEASTSEKRCDPQLRPSASQIIRRLDETETENEKDKVYVHNQVL